MSMPRTSRSATSIAGPIKMVDSSQTMAEEKQNVRSTLEACVTDSIMMVYCRGAPLQVTKEVFLAFVSHNRVCDHIGAKFIGCVPYIDVDIQTMHVIVDLLSGMSVVSPIDAKYRNMLQHLGIGHRHLFDPPDYWSVPREMTEVPCCYNGKSWTLNLDTKIMTQAVTGITMQAPSYDTIQFPVDIDYVKNKTVHYRRKAIALYHDRAVFSNHTIHLKW